MNYMFVRHGVEDFQRWKKVFDRHAEAQNDSGLHILHVLRDVADPNMLFLFFRVDDIAKAKAFTEAPSARDAGEEAGVTGDAEMWYLTD